MSNNIENLKGHSHGHHGHSHGSIDPSIASSKKGLWAVKWSFIALMITFIFQLIVVMYTGSVALLADTIHNLGDAVTAIPLGIAFLYSLKKASKKFTFGYGRVEDIAGLIIIVLILFSAVVAGYQSIERLLNPEPIKNITAVIIASIVGFIGNEAVAIFRIKVGKEIGSAALIADGQHARIDGLTSLAVLFGALGVLAGFPLADPIIGLLISVAIFKIVWDSSKLIFVRMLDGIEPEIIEKIEVLLKDIPEILEVSNVKARWIGHQIHSQIYVIVNKNISIEEGHQIVEIIEDTLMEKINYMSSVIVDLEPIDYHNHN